ncbi:MAG: TSUP family transporter [Pasteurella sp.]|nr:TSUP family transporter [Pasteurella sp.]
MELSIEILTFLFFVALIASFIDAIAGGGGLLTIPALLSVGIPPAMALGTNKLQSCAGAFSASLYFIRKKTVDLSKIKMILILSFLGGSAGTILVQNIDVNALKNVLPFLILIIAIYFLFSPKLGNEDSKQRIGLTLFGFTVAVGLGFYDGLFGPATGSFLTLAFVSLLGFNLSKAVAHAKILNFSSNLAALLFFILGGTVLWKVGFIMMIGQIIGGNLGARMVVTKGKKLIRPLIVTISLLMVTKMLWEQGYF